MNVIVCIIRYFRCSCLLIPCILHVYPCHASCLFIHAIWRLFVLAMYIACLLMPCILPVYPCHASCLFIHGMTLPVYPCHIRCLFIHAMYVACLSMPCMMAVYPCHIWYGYLSMPYVSFPVPNMEVLAIQGLLVYTSVARNGDVFSSCWAQRGHIFRRCWEIQHNELLYIHNAWSIWIQR